MKYKINNDDSDNSNISKNIIKFKEDNNNKTLLSTINIKKNKTKKVLLLSLYALTFAVTTTTTILLLDTNTHINNYHFNPNANDKLWEDYFQHHHHNQSEPIKLHNIYTYFNDSSKVVTFAVENNNVSSDNIDFMNVLQNIDSNLQTNGLENKVDNDNVNEKQLPINFFQNVNYNPAVSFSAAEKGKGQQPITASTFSIPKNYNDTNHYLLKLKTNDQAPIFGIENKDGDININIDIVNKVKIDISQLTFTFPQKEIAIANPTTTTINAIKDQLIPEIKEQFAKTLSAALNVPQDEIKDSYYQINFINGNTTPDFSQAGGAKVEFTIDAGDGKANTWGFHGKLENATINVKNTHPDLATMTDLNAAIKKAYTDDKYNKIILENEKDEKGNYRDADKKLSQQDLDFANNKIILDITTICQKYFDEHYPTLMVTKDDYQVTTNLAVGDDIFNHQAGKAITITIEAINNNKLQKSLNQTVIIHGHNKNNITSSFGSTFDLNGIWVKDHQDDNILQPNTHYYAQDILFNNWISDKNPESLFSKIKNNAYYPIAESFSGSFTVNYTLDQNNDPGFMNFDISDKSINKTTSGGKVINFWDLITKTKTIFLETKVEVKSGWSLQEVKFIFTDSANIKPNNDNTLFTFDLSSKFAGIGVTDNAPLKFLNFKFNFNYQLVS